MISRYAVATLLVCWFGLNLLAAQPVKITDPKDAPLLEGFLKHAEAVVDRLTPEYCKKTAAEDVEKYTWIVLPQSEMPLTAYELTGDPKYLDIFVRTFANMRAAMVKGPDGFTGWFGAPEKGYEDPKHPDLKIDIVINDFRAIGQLCRFIELTAADPALAKKYAKQKEEYLDLAENHLFKIWDVRQLYVDLGRTGAIYRVNPEMRQVHLTEPHNKHSIIIQGLLPLYRVTGKDEYLKHAIKLGIRYKHCLTLKDGHYEWNYWDPAGVWDVKLDDKTRWQHWIGVEHKGGYYHSSLEQAVALYEHGLVFTRADLDRFLKTQMKMCWNGDLANPKWARVDGTVDAKYMQGDYIAAALAPFEPKIGEYVYSNQHRQEYLKDIKDWWTGGCALNGWLHGKYVDLPQAKDGKQRYLEAGQRFLKKKENQDWLKSLDFEVAGPGYAPPLTPDKMTPMPPEPQKP